MARDQAAIDKLIRELKRSDDTKEQRSLRMKLRKLGHTGGAGGKPGRKPGNGNTKAKPKGRRATKREAVTA